MTSVPGTSYLASRLILGKSGTQALFVTTVANVVAAYARTWSKCLGNVSGTSSRSSRTPSNVSRTWESGGSRPGMPRVSQRFQYVSPTPCMRSSTGPPAAHSLVKWRFATRLARLSIRLATSTYSSTTARNFPNSSSESLTARLREHLTTETCSTILGGPTPPSEERGAKAVAMECCNCESQTGLYTPLFVASL